MKVHVVYLPLIALFVSGTAYARTAVKGWESANGIYAVIDTNMGTIVAKLFDKDTPKAVSNFVGLAEGTKEFTDMKTGKKTTRPFYDGLIFHRVMPDVMIQGGCPVGLGIGGPGYTFEDEFADSLIFDQPGRLAMANSGPNTNGSQFFITEAATPWLNGKYTIFGQVVQGLEVAVKISRVECERSERSEQSGKSATSTPITPVVIKTITIRRIGKEYKEAKAMNSENTAKTYKTTGWRADFSPEGIANWKVYGAGASINSSSSCLVFTVAANSWDAGCTYPNSAVVAQMRAGEAKNMNYNIAAKTGALTYDIALDEFNSAGAFVSTKWNVVENPGPMGYGSVRLEGLTFDPGTEFILPKIMVHTTLPNQSITVASLDFGTIKETQAGKAADEKSGSEKAGKAEETSAWSADFSPTGLARWHVYGDGMSFSSSGGRLVLTTTADSWDAGGAIPNSTQVRQMPINVANTMTYNVVSKTDALNYDISLDEFNSDGIYIGTKWNVVPYPGQVGANSISLSGIPYDSGTIYVLPKINIHTTAMNQSIIIASLTISE